MIEPGQKTEKYGYVPCVLCGNYPEVEIAELFGCDGIKVAIARCPKHKDVYAHLKFIEGGGEECDMARAWSRANESALETKRLLESVRSMKKGGYMPCMCGSFPVRTVSKSKYYGHFVFAEVSCPICGHIEVCHDDDEKVAVRKARDKWNIESTNYYIHLCKEGGRKR